MHFATFKRRGAWVVVALLVVSGTAMSRVENKPAQENSQEMAKLEGMLGKYAPSEMPFDARELPNQDRVMLKHLIAASQQIDEIFWRQSYRKAVEIRDRLKAAKDPISKQLFRLVMINAGPFDRLEDFKPFYGTETMPPGAGYYPADLTRKEFEDYVTAHPEQREALLSGLTVVKRKGKELVAVPYHEEYARWLEPAAKELEAAAAASASASFRRYLTSKAKALRDDNYFQTDCDWIDLKDSPYELVLGPFEVYEDQLMGIKTSYEASVAVRDVQESTRLAAYIAHLQELEDNLPYPEADRRKVAGLASPMVVVRDIYRGGDLRVGYQAAATNLPNDPKVHEKKGSKKIFFKNVFEARVDKVILPVSKELMEPSQAKLVTARGVFEDVLMHELCHALGPRYVRGTDEKVPVNQKLGDLYSAIEELKATVAGLVSMAWFFDQGIMPKATEEEHYASYLGSILRAVRFGVGEAHGRASIVELNFLQERGAIRRDPTTARWSVDASKMRGALRELTGQVLEIERAGDRAAAEALFAKYGSISPELAKDLERARSVPVEIEPIYRNLW
ncbi:MAG: Zn-dependent hydrolase [Acidobacteria bacterium]|nr:Zn-dependent hydrolase [Acidobacteriota bacterium]